MAFDLDLAVVTFELHLGVKVMTFDLTLGRDFDLGVKVIQKPKPQTSDSKSINSNLKP